MSRHLELAVPDLGLSDAPIKVTAWFATKGSYVTGGERLVELHAGEAIIDLPAPTNGRLVEQRFAEDEYLSVGDVVAVIQMETDDCDVDH